MTSIREKHLADMTPRKGMIKPAYRLRWVFRFVDGKTRYGIWNGSSNNFSDTAASINKTGLLFAQIEGEDFYGHGVKVLYECDGHDYVTAKWMAATSTGVPVGEWKVEAVTLEPDIIGLSFLTRKERASVLVNGLTVRKPHKVGDDYENVREHKL